MQQQQLSGKGSSVSGDSRLSEFDQQQEQKQHEFTIDLRQGRQKNQPVQVTKQPDPFTSDYYKDLTREKQDIKRAFEGGNFNYLRNLPDQFMHKGILDNKKERVENTKIMNNAPEILKEKKKVVKLTGGGYFEPFTYQPDEYEWAKVDQLEEKHKQKEKQQAISNLEFRPNDQKLKLKYEPPFHYEDTRQLNKLNPALDKLEKLQKKKLEYQIFPFHVQEDTYDVLKESKQRQKMIEDAKMISSEWKPSKNEKSLVKTNKQKLSEILNEIKNVVSVDWESARFLIGVNDKEQIELIFDLEALDNQDLLTNYMNALINDERFTPYQIKRNVMNWAVIDTENNTLCYQFSPPWLKESHFQAYYNIQTDQQKQNQKNYVNNITKNSSENQ